MIHIIQTNVSKWSPGGNIHNESMNEDSLNHVYISSIYIYTYKALITLLMISNLIYVDALIHIDAMKSMLK